ncbi:PREDICTED: protein RUFY3 isoform X6 [Bactrocera latifrons]|uniref:protein RUFY3 isoform X6 n=1 Tax=Bactrocera latifrons TaxID=174628 RepID=UPI0008DD5A8D|nr:PREDICTED: protein RUFY3 isoform X6 [Bactrocera latifrons]
MRSLADETRKLTLNNNNNNHSASTTIAIVTQSNSSNKIYKMQQQVNVMTSATMGVHQKQHQQQHQQQQKQLKQQQNNNSTTISLPKASHANTSEEIAGGVQDTIYLCNFRVSVDGDWLCLKELQDLDIGQQHSGGGGTSTSVYGVQRGTQLGQKNKRYSGMSNGLDDNARDPAEIERSNLVNICKLVVKELLEQSLRFGRMLDSDHLPLQHFFIVIEHVLGHGLRPKKGLLGPRKELWDLLQSVENYCPEAQDITASVRDLPTVRTHIGRARAWLRIALMQKKLADYLQALIEHRDDSLYEYYEPHALMMSDEIVVIMGILVGLNVIDCNLCVKEEDLDSQQGVIDFSLYLRSSSRSNENDEETNQSLEANGQGNMIAVLDQKNYIEELNRHLNATVGNLQAKVESLTTTNALMKEDLAIARNSLLALQAENQALRQNATITNVPTSNAEASPNKSSDRANKAAIETLNAELSEEKKKNAELDKELKLQVSLKAESDVAMKLLEKDIHEKQDTIVSLRRQLDDIKQINLEMYRKLQECEDELTQKGEMVSRLQTKASQIGNILQSLERKYESKLEQQQQLTGQPIGDKSPSSRRQQNLQKFEALTKKHRQDIGPPVKRLHLKVDAIPPFNPNNYRKSPSATVAPDKLEAEGELKTPTSAKSFTEVAKSYPDKPMDTCKSDYALSQEKI